MMKKRLILIGFVLLYIVSCVASWHMVKWNYENRWTTLHPEFDDFVIVFVPIFNTFYCFWWLIDYLGIFNLDFSEFFNITKR